MIKSSMPKQDKTYKKTNSKKKISKVNKKLLKNNRIIMDKKTKNILKKTINSLLTKKKYDTIKLKSMLLKHKKL
jgi:hypothetical protein